MTAGEIQPSSKNDRQSHSSDVTSTSAVDSDDDDDVDQSAMLTDDGNNNNNRPLSLKTSDTSVRSDASAAELHVQRQFPQFDVFVLPRHADVTTHSKDLLQISSSGEKLERSFLP
jgi:hypothetical protein